MPPACSTSRKRQNFAIAPCCLALGTRLDHTSFRRHGSRLHIRREVFGECRSRLQFPTVRTDSVLFWLPCDALLKPADQHTAAGACGTGWGDAEQPTGGDAGVSSSVPTNFIGPYLIQTNAGV